MNVIVGAGLAGLACATEMHRLGKPFLLLEAGNRVGGRLRTESREGFTLDHGFQVILSSYDAVGKIADVRALEPSYFDSGALLSYDGQLSHLANPLRHPDSVLGSVLTPAFSLRDKILLGLLGMRVFLQSDTDLLSQCGCSRDLSTRVWLENFGFSKRFLARFAEPFFGGVLLDADLESSAGLFLYYLKKFVTGRAWLPSRGIAEFPKHVASRLPQHGVRVEARVAGLNYSGGRVCSVVLESGEKISASSVVLALDEPSLCRLLDLPSPRKHRGVAVVYFKTQRSLYNRPCLVLPESGNGRVRHFTQVTNIAPAFAPEGWHLVSASILDQDIPERKDLLPVEVKNEIAAIFPVAEAMEHLETLYVSYGVPDQPPGFAGRNAFSNLPPGVYAAGDWNNGASIQAAITSGLRVAHSALKINP
jgi:protoporphyrinogen oxidase